MYIITNAKLNVTGHHWVASLTNYNFVLSFRSEKVNVDMDALHHILWDDHDQHLVADIVQKVISNAMQGTTLIEVYSCNI